MSLSLWSWFCFLDWEKYLFTWYIDALGEFLKLWWVLQMQMLWGSTFPNPIPFRHFAHQTEYENPGTWLWNDSLLKTTGFWYHVDVRLSQKANSMGSLRSTLFTGRFQPQEKSDDVSCAKISFSIRPHPHWILESDGDCACFWTLRHWFLNVGRENVPFADGTLT